MNPLISMIKKAGIVIFKRFVIINLFFVLSIGYSIASDLWEIGGTDSTNNTKEEKTEGCKECHKEVYDNIERYTYPHSDFVDKRCNYCHIALLRKRGMTPKRGVTIENIRGKDKDKDVDGHGKGLKSMEEAGIDACMEFECHPSNKLGVSHPVRVYPRGKIKIPSDLPTGEKGMLTCTTCHEPHGGNTRLFIRKKILDDLCVACHQEDNL
ncbi:MAG: hypothetical protein HY999_00170 [Nitrospinae bacterium]|nr:hypothetical protein [Nitrospinota bacterium]